MRALDDAVDVQPDALNNAMKCHMTRATAD
jgi:hypothetical protein